MKKTIYIKLRKFSAYRIESIKNAAAVYPNEAPSYVGNFLSQKEVDRLCEIENYEVTVVLK